MSNDKHYFFKGLMSFSVLFLLSSILSFLIYPSNSPIPRIYPQIFVYLGILSGFVYFGLGIHDLLIQKDKPSSSEILKKLSEKGKT